MLLDRCGHPICSVAPAMLLQLDGIGGGNTAASLNVGDGIGGGSTAASWLCQLPSLR